MNDQELSRYLSKLGYTGQWLECGLLTTEQLLVQINAYDNEQNKHTEHYRYKAFRNYLADKETLSDAEFGNYLNIALSDEDTVMASSALIDLFTKIGLSDTQFNKLVAQMKALGDWTKSTLVRQTLLRRLKHKPLTEELFQECFKNGDNLIQEYLISLANPEQLETLSLKGRVKKTRNMATQVLRQKTGS